jgi:diadenosine tetraphosphate (Ap4A) HIT family hydrolase
MAFVLHPTLAKDTVPVGDLPLCRVLLMNSRHFPWLVLVPRREALRELFDLSEADHRVLSDEIHKVSRQFRELTGAHKMNVAALGNIVPQLHIHVIARFKEDAAWPNPVWSCQLLPQNYGEMECAEFTKKIRETLAC